MQNRKVNTGQNLLHSPSLNKFQKVEQPQYGQKIQQQQGLNKFAQPLYSSDPYVCEQKHFQKLQQIANNIPGQIHQETQLHVSSENSIQMDDLISFSKLKEAIKVLQKKMEEQWRKEIVDHEKLFIDQYQKEYTSKVKSLEDFREKFIQQSSDQQSQILALKQQLNSLMNANKVKDNHPQLVQQSQEFVNNTISNQIHFFKEDLLKINEENKLNQEKFEKLIKECQTIKESVNTMVKSHDDQIQNLRNITWKLEQRLNQLVTLNEFNRSELIKLQKSVDQTKQKQTISSFQSNLEPSQASINNNQRLKNVQDLINDIYNQSWRKRSAQGEFRLFIRNVENLNELYRNYGIRSSSTKNDLAKICSSFRQARGDGNCFYTAFGFQFLNIILFSFTEIEYQQFIEKMNHIITFKINYGGKMLIESQELQQQCWDEFKNRMNFLRNQNQDELVKHYSAYEQSIDNELIDGCFYGLSTIFFRNLANYLVDNSEMKQAVFDQQNLLIWEQECNSNEVIIDELAKFLQAHVKLVFFDSGSFQIREYSNGNNQIMLLIRPGHYNIGYPPQSYQN